MQPGISRRSAGADAADGAGNLATAARATVAQNDLPREGRSSYRVGLAQPPGLGVWVVGPFESGPTTWADNCLLRRINRRDRRAGNTSSKFPGSGTVVIAPETIYRDGGPRAEQGDETQTD